jgi:hypothetical protein
MIGFRVSLLILIMFIITVILFSLNSINNPGVYNFKNNNDYVKCNISLNNNTVANSSPVIEYLIEENLTLPTKESILNNINWSNYSLLRNPYIPNYEISDPTDVINHKFLYVTIVMEVIDTKDKNEVLKQLSGVVTEEQKSLGPNSAPNAWGTVDGIWVYYTAIRPYETEVLARYIP